MSNLIIEIIISAIPIIFAITVHEAAHGRAALWCGDATAKMMGRITLNPIKHIDPIGTLLVPLLLFAAGTATGTIVPIFGWAKPVPINTMQLRNPLRDQFWVAGAGPASNLVMMLIWMGLFFILLESTDSLLGVILLKMSFVGIFSNLALMLLNLLPILPLDGGRVLMSLLPRHLAWSFSRHERYGFMIVMILLFTKVINFIFDPIFNAMKVFLFSSLH